MGKAKPLDDRIRRASWLAARARVDLNLFAVLTPLNNVDVSDEQWTLFQYIHTAHEHAFLARIVNLFAPQPDTDNFPRLVDEAERVGAIDAATSAAIKAQIEAADSAYKAAKVIRNKVVAHQDDTLTKPEIYKQVEPTLAMFITLSNQSLAIAGALCSARGLRPQAVPTKPAAQLEKIVLAELPGWESASSLTLSIAERAPSTSRA